MEKLKLILKYSGYVLFAFFLFHTTHVIAQDCPAKLAEMNSNKSGIPSGRIDEYESCVSDLWPSKENYKALLRDCYNKLISYYDSLDDQSKVNFYTAKRDEL